MIIIIIKILLMFTAIALVMIFSGGETAIASLEYRGALKEDEENFSARAKSIVSLWRQFPLRILTTVLIGNNMFVIMVSVLATSAAIDFAGYAGISKSKTTFVFSAVAAVLVFIFSDMTPKILARVNPKKFFITVAPMLWSFDKLILPINRIFGKQVFLFSDLLGIDLMEKKKRVSDQDIQEFLDIGESDGTIESGEKDVIEAMLEFGDIMVKDIMVPRAHMDCLDIKEGLENVIERVNKLKHSRLPIYEGSIENIVGLIYAKDLLIAWQNRYLIIIQDLVRPAYFIPPTKKVNELLREFKRGLYHLAVIVDEYGTVLGLITIEDIIEEIVGDILDEYDVDDAVIKPLAKSRFLVDPSIELDVLDKKLKIELEHTVPDDVRTLSGYIMHILGRLPKKNEIITKDNLTFFIQEMEKTVIKKVVIYKKK
ncbi:hemolysin family protein [bacterium]